MRHLAFATAARVLLRAVSHENTVDEGSAVHITAVFFAALLAGVLGFFGFLAETIAPTASPYG